MSLGFRAFTRVDRPSQVVLEHFTKLSTCDVSDAIGEKTSAGKFWCMAHQIKPMYSPMHRVAGAAVTVRVPPGDNLMVHRAIGLVQQGDVLVIAAGGDVTCAYAGGLICALAQKNGAVGLVVDGGIRDLKEIQDIDFPVLARAAIPSAGTKNGPGEINAAVSCGGVLVNPGDIVVADEDGVVVVPKELAKETVTKAQAIADRARTRREELDLFEKEHCLKFNRLLIEKGCEVID
jgi:RraA family protein